MSADNGIYIAHFAHDDSWRVVETQCIDNVTYYQNGSNEYIQSWKDYFEQAYPARSYEEALAYASILESEIANSDFPILEYGIASIGEGPDIGQSRWKHTLDQLWKSNSKVFTNFIIDWGKKRVEAKVGSIFEQLKQTALKEPTFWTVWNPEVGYPTVRHSSFEEAETEATRLAQKENTFIYILQCTHKIQLSNPKLETVELK